MIGLTSITFRHLSPRQILDLAATADLQGVEWGSDVHVPAGDIYLAREVSAACKEAAIAVTSYGSYFKAGALEDPAAQIETLIKSAKALGAPVIRVWAGEKSPAAVNDTYRQRVERDLSLFVSKAAAENLQVATEYHRGTLTENAESTLSLLEAVPGLKTYWQPNPDISEARNLEELDMVLPYLVNVHVFQWTAPGNVRHPLEEGRGFWMQCIQNVLADQETEHHFLLEFVTGDQPEQCIRDAKVLRDMVEGILT